MPRIEDIILRGTLASQPAANTVATGSLYYITDQQQMQRSNGTTWDDVSTGGTVTVPPPTQNASFVLFGGQVTWQSGLTFVISATTYYIQGTLYTIAQQTITLDAADATNPRLDVIGVDTSPAGFKITGTPSSNPSAPTVDPTTQLDLTIISVPANATTPPITSTTLYTENAGAPGEWNWTTSGSGIVTNSSTTPRTGSTCIRGTNMAAAAYAQGAAGGADIDINDYDQLVFYIRNTSSWANGRTLQVRWLESGVTKGNAITIQNNAWGFSSTDTTTYQVIALDTILFAVPVGTLVNQIRIIDVGGALSFGIDDMALVGGGGGGSGGITLTQADARYIQLGNAAESDLNHLTGLNYVDGASGAMPWDMFQAGTGVTFTESNESGAIVISTSAAAPDASTTTYTPASNEKWNDATDPGNVDGGLDQLAARVADMERAIDANMPSAPWEIVQDGAAELGRDIDAIEFIIDGGGSAITTGVKGDVEVPFACTITQATTLADQSGSIVIDIWKDVYANYPPTVADTITASAKPTLSSATNAQDSTLTGWTRTIAAGDTLRFNVDSASTVTRVTLSLKITRA